MCSLCAAAQDTGVFNEKVEARNMQEMMMTNPDMMQGMMKQQMSGLVPQVGAVHVCVYVCVYA